MTSFFQWSSDNCGNDIVDDGQDDGQNNDQGDGQNNDQGDGQDGDQSDGQDNGQGTNQEGQQSAPLDAKLTAAQSACRLSALKLHNSLRRNHGVADLVLDDAINSKAQAYAEYLASNNLFQHSTDRDNLGENLYASFSSNPLFNDDNGAKATQGWYDEIKDYDFDNQGFSMSTGHFTQVVWKGTNKLGIGIGFANGGRNVVVVGNYGPAGNMQGDFEANVFPPQ